jgi:bacillopeptidase F (M6 metalloprotease family)
MADILSSTPNRLLVFATYFGGSNYDWANRVLLDGQGLICIIGGTRSKDLPVKSAFDKTYNGQSDGFVAELSEAQAGAEGTRKR